MRRGGEEANSKTGICVAFYFSSDGWSGHDWRRGRCAKLDPEQVADELREEAARLSASGEFEIEVIVLDGSLPSA